MLNDEQILLKAINLLENFDISNKKPEKLLREITESEIEIIDDLLDDLKGEELAFNDLFGGKMRLVIDFPTLDTTSRLGRFVNMFKELKDTENNSGYAIDWEKGIISGTRTLADSSTSALAAHLAGSGPPTKKERKIQMKLGKWFAKIYELGTKRQVIIQEFWKRRHEKLFRGERPYKHNTQTNISTIPGTELQELLTTEEIKRYDQLSDQLRMYVGDMGITRFGQFPEAAKKDGKYWQENAGYIKKNIGDLYNDKYAMIITRHPLDILRMADFDNISSCHSPPSRGGEASYYKCAVAESRGHGAVVYVVETDMLFAMTESDNLEEVESKIQEGEIFADPVRGSHVGLYHPTNYLLPLSRLRLRQVKYYSKEDTLNAKLGVGVEIAVPERREYGTAIPGIRQRVLKWAQEHQEAQLEAVDKDDKHVYLKRFIKFGGSYEDNAIRELIEELFGLESVGSPIQDTETEDNLDANLLGDLVAIYTNQCQEITDDFNARYAACEIDFDVEDDGGGGVYITVNAAIEITWEVDDWKKLPSGNNTHAAAEYAAQELNEYGYGYFNTDTSHIKRRDKDNIVWIGRIESEMIPDTGAGGYAYDPDNYQEFCQGVDKIDDQREIIKSVLTNNFKREGYMEGGEFVALAVDIENGEIDSYEWDLDSDGNYDDSYEAEATITHDYNPEKLKIDPQGLSQILDSREFKLALRSALLAPAREQVHTEYYLDIGNTSATESGGDLRYGITFQITADDPDERVKLFRELVTGDMDDEETLHAIFEKTMAQMVNAGVASTQQQSIAENYSTKEWREFLK